jgi:hypothetical protein
MYGVVIRDKSISERLVSIFIEIFDLKNFFYRTKTQPLHHNGTERGEENVKKTPSKRATNKAKRVG